MTIARPQQRTSSNPFSLLTIIFLYISTTTIFTFTTTTSLQ